MNTRKPVALALVTLLLLSVPGYLCAEETQDKDEYAPYEESEFPDWLVAVRRAEIVLIGSFPITMLVSSLAYDGFRSVRDLVLRTPVAGRSEFGSFTAAERPWLLLSGVSLAAIVTVIDAVIEQRRRRSAPSTAE